MHHDQTPDDREEIERLETIDAYIRFKLEKLADEVATIWGEELGYTFGITGESPTPKEES